MKKYGVFLLSVLLIVLAASTAASGGLVVHNGLVVPSAESCMAGVPPCDEVFQHADRYTYCYNGCGAECDGAGSNAVWAQFEAYAQQLGSSGFFEIIKHEQTSYGFHAWYLKYTGPAKVDSFQMKGQFTPACDIMVQSFTGDVSVRYSNDIATTDLAETMARFGLPMPGNIVEEPKEEMRKIIHFDVSTIAHYFEDDEDEAAAATLAPATPAPATPAPAAPAEPAGLIECEICEKGNCKRCGGDGYAYRTVLNIRTGKHETTNGRCTAQLCLDGSCTACGGDGWLGN